MDPREPAHLCKLQLIRVLRTLILGQPARRSGALGAWLRTQFRLALLALLLVGGLLGSLSQGAFQFLTPTASAHSLGKPTPSASVNVPENTTSVTHPGFGKTTPGNAPAGPPQSLKRTGGITMRPGMVTLDALHDIHFTGSDGRLEVDVPAGAVTSGDMAAAGGRIALQISQIAPASGSSAGGSGIVSLGTYLVQAVDADGVLLTHGLRQPVTLTLHYSSRETALDLTHLRVDFNGTLPDGTTLAPLVAQPVQPTTPGLQQDVVIASPPTPTQANSHFGALTSEAASLDTASKSLTIAPLLADPSTSLSWNTDSPVATFGSPDPYNVDLNAGSLTSTFNLDVPSGPGGLTPPVQLTYSSAAVSEQHNAQGAAGWVGEGWNLDLGAITWAEHDSNGGCSPTCGNGWEDTWDLSDPFGTSVELIPPNINVSTYFDDGPNVPVTLVQWHSTPENYAKIYSYAGPLTLPDGANLHPPCFRVWLTNGIMEEFGCTSDSLQYYPSSTGNHDFISAWHLDLITDPHGNQIHITYTQDSTSKVINGVSHTYIRDTVLKTIEWDSPTCQNYATACTTGGTAPSKWAPLMRVSFSSTHSALARVTRGSHGCNSNTSLRCDDPVTVSGGLAAPDVESTFALNDALVQVRSSGTGSWNLLKDYQFSYSQDGPQQIQDPVTGEQVSEAGSFLLTTLKTLGADGSTALPARTFTYFWNVNFYVDDAFHPTPTTNCGSIAWNTGTGTGCLLWGRSFWSNSYYLWTANNGMGLQQTFTWDNARNNTHGVNGGGASNTNPLYCNGLTAAQQATYPCSEVDDQNWSHIVLTQQEDDVVQVAAGGNTQISSITQYAYTLTALTARQCSDCLWGMYWGSQNDADHLDYYNSKFMGFAEADVSNPDGSVVKHWYLSTEGYGVYDSTVPCLSPNGYCDSSPWWDLGNAAHGHEYRTDSYDTDGTTLLKRVMNVYKVVCPPSGVAASPPWSTTIGTSPYTYTWDSNLVAELDHGNPVAVCDVQTEESDTFTFDGTSQGDGTTIPYTSIPHSSVSYVYDSKGRISYQTTGADTGLKVQYFQDDTLNNADLKLTRLEANVNNTWGTGSPFPTIHGNGFSARWTGYVKPQYTGTYTFYTYSDDGVRLYVNNTLVVDNWTDHSPTENSGTIALTAGQLYPITLEYYDKTGSATMQLSWSEASQPKQIIPAAAFFTRSDGGGGSATGSVPVTVVYTQYIQNDSVTATNTSATGTYLIDIPADTITQDGSGSTHYSCSYTSYDDQDWAIGQQGSLSYAEATSIDTYTSCSPSGNSGLIRHLYSYDSYGNKLTDLDPDANTGVTSHQGCTVDSSTYTSCQAYDTTYDTLPTTTTNALNQTVTTGYATSSTPLGATNGWGLWPISVKDANTAETDTAYDALGRVVKTALPGDAIATSPTTTTTYTVWCTPPGPQGPCIEVDNTQRINSTTTVTSRSFYDGFGRLIETRTPSLANINGINQDVVQFAQYDAAGREVFQSVPYFVPTYIGNPGGAAFSYPDTTQAHAALAYTSLLTSTTYDALGHGTTTTSSVVCNPSGTSDSACYEQVATVDAINSKTATLSDGLGRTTYTQTY